MSGAGDIVHATVIAVGQRAVLIRGRSGSGKSDLALRCLSLGPSPLLPTPARLISDDQVVLTRRGPALAAAAPDTLRGKIEVRGLGVVDIDAIQQSADVVLVAELTSDGDIARLPDPWPTANVMGLAIPLIRLAPFEPSAPMKLLTALVRADLPAVGARQ